MQITDIEKKGLIYFQLIKPTESNRIPSTVDFTVNQIHKIKKIRNNSSSIVNCKSKLVYQIFGFYLHRVFFIDLRSLIKHYCLDT